MTFNEYRKLVRKEACRGFRVIILCAVIGLLIGLIVGMATSTASADSFTVVTKGQNADAYDRVAEAAYLKQSKFWFGKSHRALADKCEIFVDEKRRGAGGATTFGIRSRDAVSGWKMKVQGRPQVILDSVIPHEVNHVVFAAHFGKPLPRFWDEGASGIFDPHGIQTAHALFRSRKLRFATRDVMDLMQYPKGTDIGLFYAQGWATTRYLVEKHGAAKFVAFLKDDRKPSDKLSSHFGVSPEQLDVDWMADYKADTQVAQAKPRRPAKRIVYVFTDPINCPPCRRFEADYKAGKLRRSGFEFKFVRFGTPEYTKLRAEYKRTVGRDDGTVPRFWVYKTKYHQAGYNGPGGLLGFLLAIPKAIFNVLTTILVGGPAFGAPAAPGPEKPPYPRSEPPTAAAGVRQTFSDAEQLKKDIKEFKEAGLIGKLRLIDNLKTDVANLRADKDGLIKTAKDQAALIAQLREKIKEHGGIVGVVKERLDTTVVRHSEGIMKVRADIAEFKKAGGPIEQITAATKLAKDGKAAADGLKKDVATLRAAPDKIHELSATGGWFAVASAIASILGGMKVAKDTAKVPDAA